MYSQILKIDLEIEYKNLAKFQLATSNIIRGLEAGHIKYNP
jgi:hypothetical protein